MNIQNIWLFSDLDGTLLPSDKQIPEDVCHAIQQFIRQGGHFTIATGRTMDSARIYWEQLAIREPMILYNGAMIYDPITKTVLHQTPLCSFAKEMTAKVLQAFPEAGCEILCPDGTYVIRNTIYEQEHVAICRITPQYCTLETMPERAWMKVLFAVNPRDMLDLQVFIQEQNWTEADFIQSSESFYEMLPKDVSKGSALLTYRKKMKILNSAIVIAAGDYQNDQTMLEYANYGIAPANAQSEIKEVADVVLQNTCDQGAIAELLTWISLNLK